MALLAYWFRKKIKVWQFGWRTLVARDRIRKGFAGRGRYRAPFAFVREHCGPLLASFILIPLLTFSFLNKGDSRPGPAPLKKGRPVRAEIDSAPRALSNPPAPGTRRIRSRRGPEPMPATRGKFHKPWRTLRWKETFRKREVRFTLMVDKTSRRLFVTQRGRNSYRVLREFPVSVGQIRGDKIQRGDKRTPEGIYRIIDMKFDPELLPIYGPMAFVLSYPNDRDRLLGKTGSGIWLHGTGRKVLTPDTKGCVELTDQGILDLSAYVAYNTPVFIFPERHPLVKKGNKIPMSIVNGLEMEYVRELPMLRARLEARKGGGSVRAD